MLTIVDLSAALAKLTMLSGRTPETPAAAWRNSTATLLPYRDGGVFAAKFAGKGAWERHPQADEIVQILDGAATLHVVTPAGRQSLTLRAGMLVVVPQNAWHRFEAPDGVALITATPQPTEHLPHDVDDPSKA